MLCWIYKFVGMLIHIINQNWDPPLIKKKNDSQYILMFAKLIKTYVFVQHVQSWLLFHTPIFMK